MTTDIDYINYLKPLSGATGEFNDPVTKKLAPNEEKFIALAAKLGVIIIANRDLIISKRNIGKQFLVRLPTNTIFSFSPEISYIINKLGNTRAYTYFECWLPQQVEDFYYILTPKTRT